MSTCGVSDPLVALDRILNRINRIGLNYEVLRQRTDRSSFILVGTGFVRTCRKYYKNAVQDRVNKEPRRRKRAKGLSL